MERRTVVRLVLSVAAVAVAVAVGFYLERRRESTPVPTGFKPHGDCGVETASGKMPDLYLPGILELGAPFTIEKNWYNCHPPKDGEVVALKVAQNLPPVYRVIRGVPGDHFAVERDSTGKRWNLRVNGDVIQDHDGALYFFGGTAPPTLQLYVEPRGGVLREGEVIVLATRSPGNMDSAALGVMSTLDLIGRVSPQNH